MFYWKGKILIQCYGFLLQYERELVNREGLTTDDLDKKDVCVTMFYIKDFWWADWNMLPFSV